MPGTTTNQKLLDWVEQWRSIFEPDDVYWCDGTAEEYDRMCQELVDAGVFEKLNDAFAYIETGRAKGKVVVTLK